ncbi:hypothetical protein VTH06DRAFT_1474 [Thermothelomyces fergusii]
MGILGVTVVRDGEVQTTTVVTETSNAITAHGIQVRFKSDDLIPTSCDDDSVFVPGRTEPPSFSSTPTTTASSSSSGVDTSTAIGIGLGSAAVALFLAGAIGLLFFFRWRRKKKSRQALLDIPPPVPPKDRYPSLSSPSPRHVVPPPYELSEEAALPRRRSISKRHHLVLSPATGPPVPATRTLGGGPRDSGVVAGQDAAELEVPSTAAVRGRAAPEPEWSCWTDRHARVGTVTMPWI